MKVVQSGRLSDFQRGQVVARSAGVSVTKQPHVYVYPEEQFPRLRWHKQIMGRHQLREIVVENQN